MSTSEDAIRLLQSDLSHTTKAVRLRRLYENATDPGEKEKIGQCREALMVTCPFDELGQMREAWEGSGC
ncbi:hypothetical protein [Synechococcus sp. 1G10]|uniref:hypothetical protein n=1 Tax=Synechococcus sp. 1G10 TaxID=2025605 RepID=UPI001E4F1470|nr:hypothetical protein [Synechococcus sp. 1G10]